MNMYSLPNFVAFSVVKNAETVCFYTWIFFIFFIQIVCGFSHVLWCYFIHYIEFFIYLFIWQWVCILWMLFVIRSLMFFIFYLYQYYVTCITIQNSLQFENELKKVGTFVHLFICSFVSRLTFLASLFIFPFFLLFYYFMFLYCEGYYPWHLNKYLRCFGKCFKKQKDFFKQS